MCNSKYMASPTESHQHGKPFQTMDPMPYSRYDSLEFLK